MRVKPLLPLAGLLAASLAMAPASSTGSAEAEQGPIGVCAHVPRVDPDPICVLVELKG